MEYQHKRRMAPQDSPADDQLVCLLEVFKRFVWNEKVLVQQQRNLEYPVFFK